MTDAKPGRHQYIAKIKKVTHSRTFDVYSSISEGDTFIEPPFLYNILKFDISFFKMFEHAVAMEGLFLSIFLKIYSRTENINCFSSTMKNSENSSK